MFYIVIFTRPIYIYIYIYIACKNQPCEHKLHQVIFLNQACALFLNIVSVRTLVCVCMSAPSLLTINGVI